MDALLNCLAPAKLNLFLHVIGRRSDGYHLLQSVFQLIDWCDSLDFHRRDDGQIVRINDIPGVPAEQDLVVRAAKLLQAQTACKYGVEIKLHKQLPMGGGLGGGSSDAATTLLALNRLWGLHLTNSKLCELGLQLGADIPFFLFGQNAFVEGIGEQLQALPLPKQYFVVVAPPIHVPTPAIFSASDLTRDTSAITIADFLAAENKFAFGRNDLQSVATRQYAEIKQGIQWLSQFSQNARMTGSGACFFASFTTEQAAQTAYQEIPTGWRGKVCQGLAQHPMFDEAR